MPPETLSPDLFSSDVREFLGTLFAHDVRFMIVGGEAVIFYGHVRLTGDIEGVPSEDAWPYRTEVVIGDGPDGIPFDFIGLDDLIANKKAAGRVKDLDDLRFLCEVRKSRSHD